MTAGERWRASAGLSRSPLFRMGPNSCRVLRQGPSSLSLTFHSACRPPLPSFRSISSSARWRRAVSRTKGGMPRTSKASWAARICLAGEMMTCSMNSPLPKKVAVEYGLFWPFMGQFSPYFTATDEGLVRLARGRPCSRDRPRRYRPCWRPPTGRAWTGRQRRSR